MRREPLHFPFITQLQGSLFVEMSSNKCPLESCFSWFFMLLAAHKPVGTIRIILWKGAGNSCVPALGTAWASAQRTASHLLPWRHHKKLRQERTSDLWVLRFPLHMLAISVGRKSPLEKENSVI